MPLFKDIRPSTYFIHDGRILYKVFNKSCDCYAAWNKNNGWVWLDD